MGIDQAEQLIVHGVGFRFLGRPQRLRGAVVQVIFHQIARDTTQRFLRGGNLHDDVCAIAVIGNHFLQAADLAFDAPQTLLICGFNFGIDGEGLMARANDTGAFARTLVFRIFGRHAYLLGVDTYTPTPYPLSNRGSNGTARKFGLVDEAGIMPA